MKIKSRNFYFPRLSSFFRLTITFFFFEKKKKRMGLHDLAQVNPTDSGVKRLQRHRSVLETQVNTIEYFIFYFFNLTYLLRFV